MCVREKGKKMEQEIMMKRLAEDLSHLDLEGFGRSLILHKRAEQLSEKI